MKAMPTDDPLFGKGIIRADGRKMHPMYLLQVKTPANRKSEWDVFKIVGDDPSRQGVQAAKRRRLPASQELSVARSGLMTT